MVTVKCKHSGIEFEARTSRTTQHPKIADLKNEANRSGNYRQVLEALDSVREDGGYDDIDQYLQLVNEIITDSVNAKRQREKARAQAEYEARKAASAHKAERDNRNALLRKNGYRWEKGFYGRVDQDEYFDSPPDYWVLIAPDGDAITESDALAVIRGEKELAGIRKAEADRREREHQAEKAEEAAEAAFEAAKEAARTIEVAPYEYSDFKQVAERRHGVSVDSIYAGVINGVNCTTIHHYFGGHDYDEWTRYYCEEPETAGLERIERDPSSFEETWARIWR